MLAQPAQETRCVSRIAGGVYLAVTLRSVTALDWPHYLLLVVVGAVASAINSVAGGGSLVSFPTLTLGLGIPSKIANATNSVGLWPGSLGGALGFRNLLGATQHHLKTLLLPTVLGSVLGAWLLIQTKQRVFDAIVPALILLAALLLAFQPQVKKWALGHRQSLSTTTGVVLQFIVATYGGYFGAGMGIMMLAAFALYMEGTIHEINAVKNWLGVAINLVATAVFVSRGVVLFGPALALRVGGSAGGFAGAKISQKMDPEKLRIGIAVYGVVTAAYFAKQYWFGG